MIGASYFFYAYWDARLVVLLLGVTVICQLAAIVVAHQDERSRRTWAMGIGVAATIAPLLFFKYYGFFTVNVTNTAAALGLPLSPPLIQVVLPIGVSFYTFMAISYVVDVYHRRVPARVLDRRHAVPVVLPAPRGRTDRAARGADPPAGRAPRRAPRRCGGRRLADPGRSLQEGRDRELPGDRDRRSGLRRARPTRMAGDPRRHRRLRGADLLRLQRLHRHRDRHREAARVPVPAELRPSLQRPLDPGVLASLAHDAVPLAARLPLHPARWEPQGHRAHLREPDDHDAARRSVARRGVALRGLGRTARGLPRDRSMETARCGSGGSSPPCRKGSGSLRCRC